MDLRLTVAIQGPAAVIQLHGGLDGHTSPTLRDAVEAALAARVGLLVLDLSDLQLLDARGVSAIAACRKLAKRQGTTVTVRDPNSAATEAQADRIASSM